MRGVRGDLEMDGERDAKGMNCVSNWEEMGSSSVSVGVLVSIKMS